jgi:basic amino acid/polyamine antiporter, APA family
MSVPAAAIEREAGLVRALGVFGLAASIVNITIGGGIFRLPSSPDVAGRLGAAAPVAYIVCAIAMALIVMCFAEAGSRVSLTGGPYAYVETAFGPLAGFMVGVLLWLTGIFATSAVATIFADNVARLVPFFGPRGLRITLLALVFAFLVAVNVRGVKQGARLNAVSTLVKLAPLVLLAVVGLFAIRPDYLAWTATPAPADVTRASIFLIFAFAGIESALVPSGEVRDPARTVPRAVFLAMAIVTVMYIVLHVVAQGTLGPDLVGSATPLADAAGRVFGNWGAALLSFGVVLSTFGYLSGMTLATPRSLFAFARDGFLPGALCAVHPRFHTPHIAIMVQASLALLLAVTNEFERLAILANVSALLVYLGCALAAWQLRRKDVRTGGLPFKIPGGAVAPWLAVLVILVLLSSITLREWLVVAVVLALAFGVYWVARGGRRVAGGTSVG